MFISEEEANERLRSSDNLLRRLGIDANPSEEMPKSQVDEALEEAQRNPTIPSEDDAVRLAVLAGRRHLKTSDERGGRYPQQGNIPPIFRSLIGTSARLGTVKNTAKVFGVSQVTTSQYKHGKVGDREDQSLQDKIERDTLAVRDQVLGVLAFTIAGITPESVENKDAKELSIIARNLSSIMSSTKPAEVAEKNTNAQVIVFSPDREEPSYDTVEIG